VRVEVATRGANRERDVCGLLDRDAVAPDRQPGDHHTERGERDDEPRDDGVRERAVRRSPGTRACGIAPPSSATFVSVSSPSDGVSQSLRPIADSTAPAPTEPTASTIIGTVIVTGDSCGW